jgi:hypothetical protein
MLNYGTMLKAPDKLNVTQWVEVVEAMGARYAWLTAKHGCGFLLFPTKTTLPDGRPFGYDVGSPECPTHVDIVGECGNPDSNPNPMMWVAGVFDARWYCSRC